MRVTFADGRAIEVPEAAEPFARFKVARDELCAAMSSFTQGLKAADRARMQVAAAEAQAAASHCEAALREIGAILTSRGIEPSIGEKLTEELGSSIHEAMGSLRVSLGPTGTN